MIVRATARTISVIYYVRHLVIYVNTFAQIYCPTCKYNAINFSNILQHGLPPLGPDSAQSRNLQIYTSTLKIAEC